jgi:hypothetical protein
VSSTFDCEVGEKEKEKGKKRPHKKEGGEERLDKQ